MKKANLILRDRKNQDAIQFILNTLCNIFDGYVEFKELYANELSEDTKLVADAFLVSDEKLYSKLRRHIDDFSKVIKLRRSPNVRAVKLLEKIPQETPVLFVNDTFQSALESIYAFYDCGLGNIIMVPYDSAQLGNGLYDRIETAITVGERELVPKHIKNIIDIGYREVSLDTMVNLAQLLDLEIDRVNRNLFRHMKLVVESSSTFLESYVYSFLKSEMLKRVIEKSSIGTVLLDGNFKIVYANSTACKIFAVDDKSKIDINEYISSNELKSDDVLSKPINILGEKYHYDKYAINIIDDIAGYYITLQDAKRLSIKAHHLKQKGFYAKYNFNDIAFTSPKMKNVVNMAKRIAGSSETVLIRGDSGTGKELIAQSIHNYSDRRLRPFVAINCAALPETLLESELFGYEPGAFTGARSKGKVGLFEEANHGTIFLDEIGDVSLKMQARLLRTIQEMQIMKIGSDKLIDIDVRIIAATNKNLEVAMDKGEFRIDLFYRLNVFPLIVPPLRKRKEDIFPLLQNFLGNKFKSLSQTEREILLRHHWPGNVRELRNVSLYYNSLMQLPEYLLSDDLLQSQDITGKNTKIPSYHGINVPEANGLNAVVPAKNFYPHLHNSKDNKNIKCILLDIIYQGTQPAHGMGRTLLVHILKSNGVNISDGKLREILALLEDEGLIEIGKGRQGTRITVSGQNYLNDAQKKANKY